MAQSLVELTANIVSSHASGSQISRDELIQEINDVYNALKQLESNIPAVLEEEIPTGPVLTFKKAFQNDQVGCMICGKTGFKTLTRHLKQAQTTRQTGKLLQR